MRTLIATLLTAGLLAFAGTAIVSSDEAPAPQAARPGGFEWDHKK